MAQTVRLWGHVRGVYDYAVRRSAVPPEIHERENRICLALPFEESFPSTNHDPYLCPASHAVVAGMFLARYCSANKGFIRLLSTVPPPTDCSNLLRRFRGSNSSDG